ncbi:orotidine-5'-phosphate decarboxylase [Marinicella litoralis]|uniref:Orotidine 5'-phosphate decarboxylase n=1 Tax=Marinicella litoralis TaxID=644220 RepID=A0A4R6Y098_9GAMM|nr:orotidine-5'-phosphate decarboxylase [Marinicella litoralis]TDR23523.1 orotidine-5'-phosphate decarboxylase [Marinicella litoralis]
MFIQQLEHAQDKNQSLVCVGLDPNAEKLSELGVDLLPWLTAIVDATAAHVCAFKPQIAYFAALKAETELTQIIQYIQQNHPTVPVILDAKRGDIGSTADQYAAEAFQRYQADAVTVNPYMGGDTIEPYSKFKDKGVVVLCKTSNAGSGELQNLTLANGDTLFQTVAKKASQDWNHNHNLLLVVGATYPNELATIRQLVGDMPLLIPGIGAQGGDVEATLKAGLRTDGKGLIISSSRGIIYAGDKPENYAAKAEQACIDLKNTINAFR